MFQNDINIRDIGANIRTKQSENQAKQNENSSPFVEFNGSFMFKYPAIRNSRYPSISKWIPFDA